MLFQSIQRTFQELIRDEIVEATDNDAEPQSGCIEFALNDLHVRSERESKPTFLDWPEPWKEGDPIFAASCEGIRCWTCGGRSR